MKLIILAGQNMDAVELGDITMIMIQLYRHFIKIGQICGKLFIAMLCLKKVFAQHLEAFSGLSMTVSEMVILRLKRHKVITVGKFLRLDKEAVYD